MAFNTFSGLQKQSSLQIIQYEGPPKPKQRSQQPPSKTPSHAERGGEERLMTTLDKVELVNLTGLGKHPNSWCLFWLYMMTDRDLADIEANCKISGSEGESGDVGIDDGRDRVSMLMSQEDRGDKNPCPREPSGSCSQGERSTRL
jgi:hypothetical protein